MGGPQYVSYSLQLALALGDDGAYYARLVCAVIVGMGGLICGCTMCFGMSAYRKLEQFKEQQSAATEDGAKEQPDKKVEFTKADVAECRVRVMIFGIGEMTVGLGIGLGLITGMAELI